MSDPKVHIEDLYRSHFEGYTVEPSSGMWTRIRYKLMWNEFFRFSLNTFNAYYLGAALLAATGAIILISTLTRPEMSKQVISPEESVITGDTSAPGQGEATEQYDMTTGQETGRPGREKQTGSETKAGKLEAGQPDTDKQTKVTDKETTTEPRSSEPGILKEQGPEETEESVKAETLAVAADFEMSRQEGCAPLTVDFINKSENAVSQSWIFGDGGSSDVANPGYVFDEPGEYSVTLKITGTDGKEYSASSTVTVYTTPKAHFEIDNNVTITSGQPVYFYNYSRDADYYEWDFGDQTRSNLAEPVHYYDSPGSYDVKLKVWTENRCYDSVTILNAFTPTKQEVIFPNAFTPNMNGPVGGYYQLNDPKNEVFHPVITGDVVEYELKIFNRAGYQVFESNDVNIGWDGYYKEQLGAQGVYIWKARVRFVNGKTIVRSGDVTLIWLR
jgi:PKD repeat protein